MGRPSGRWKARTPRCSSGEINLSGQSSWEKLQNMSASDKEQPLAIAIAAAEELLQGEGACRLHGGGFAGTTLNFVPLAKVDEFVRAMGTVFGEGCCDVLSVRMRAPAGCSELDRWGVRWYTRDELHTQHLQGGVKVPTGGKPASRQADMVRSHGRQYSLDEEVCLALQLISSVAPECSGAILMEGPCKGRSYPPPCSYGSRC